MPRAPRMLALFDKWGMEEFRHGGLCGNINHGESCSAKITHRGYTSSRIVLLDKQTIVLYMTVYKDDNPRTYQYSEPHSERLDEYMNALEAAIVEKERANAERVKVDNERSNAKRIYEENLF